MKTLRESEDYHSTMALSPERLISSATSQSPIISPDLKDETAIASDPSRPLLARIDAFEDISDTEVGDTNLSRARNLEREVGLRQIFLKFEGGNPTGTQKDRIAFAQVMDALRRGFDAITVAPASNYGAAISLAASLAGLKCILYLPETHTPSRLQDMLDYKPEIIRVPGDYSQAILASRARASADSIYDANPGGDNSAIQLQAYAQIAHEIYDELRDAPAAIAVPISNGTTLAGIYRGFLNLYRRGKTSRMPRMIAGSSFGKNTIVRAFGKKLPHCQKIKGIHAAKDANEDTLINWDSIDGDAALEAIRQTGGLAEHVSDRNMSMYARMIRELDGFDVLPASSAGLLALIDSHLEQALPGDRYVAIITGRK